MLFNEYEKGTYFSISWRLKVEVLLPIDQNQNNT